MNRYDILIIEDDKNTQEIIEESLKTRDFFVDSVSDGLEGIQKFKEKKYDLVLLNISMPNLDGFTVCKMIRKMSEVPIVFISSKNDEATQIKGYDCGCDDFIVKPFSFNVLAKKIEAILKRTSKLIDSDTLEFEDMVLGLRTYSVTISGESVELTLKEFYILKMLIEKYPQVITRENLLDNIWGYDFYGDTRIIDAHIKNIRKKIKLPYIKTVKGIGYTLDKK
ncbi:response regulator transcription factor [Peptostreptococcus russellii]|uniref:Stage 0 sporulation protein A homolog n=1 Tax=Peptostreptococcus russellii TaxID=215200 RepID=A0A1H8INJ9_9FIRM|nr:response regulator transcription factor [Peptostreptococcus russellii]SEN69228.1 two-component system, OmpR family, response regulator VanR [Peptostreptococcus russellii]